MKKQILYFLIGSFILLAIIMFPKPKSYSYYEANYHLNEVEINGAVNNPGTYLVPEGVNLAYLINLAGGLKLNADTSSLNLGILLTNNQYEIPYYEAIDQSIPVGKLNLNTARFSELLLIPNITESRATNILIYRNENGSFKSIDELLLVKGIGQATFDKIKNYFTV